MTKDIPGYENLYSVSEAGIVTAYEKIIKMPKGGIKKINEHIPVHGVTKKGYLKVWLTKDKTRKLFFVHRLVLKTFIGDSKLQVNHKNKIKTDNRLENLEYVTNRENCVHRLDKTKTSSKYIGVAKHRNKWVAQKFINGRQNYIGLFATELEAHNAYLNYEKSK